MTDDYNEHDNLEPNGTAPAWLYEVKAIKLEVEQKLAKQDAALKKRKRQRSRKH